MSTDPSDERVERIVRRAVRKELELLGERLFWTFVSALGLFWGLLLVASGANSPGDLSLGFAVFGAALALAAVRTLLLTWELPPYRSAPDE
ncbi:hypothetical protein NGM10_11870 [Halorussus salilacus]|uniref:hypothetical protein n=1 Tax=Halorussus salilacus TaxID=2953750 RepID=UPI0020A031D1|nr:hypothetical protein [Halorussus salilacus]USZ67423.1 hypothetical protein NGM10_11870 [Halorussus salilacus]